MQKILSSELILSLLSVWDIIVVLVTCTCTCKNEDDLINNESARGLKALYIILSDDQGQIFLASVVVSCQNLSSSELSCMPMSSARMKIIQSKMKVL